MHKVETIEQRADRIVRQEVNCCLSTLVATLAPCIGDVTVPRRQPQGSPGQSLYDLVEQATELSNPIDDYEEAAIQAGWEHLPRALGGQNVYRDKTDGQTWCAKDWETLCLEHEIEPYQREVYEHWAVSQWLGEKLAAHGERVDFDFAGLVVWARTTSGQGIAQDGVIQRIAEELLK